MHTETPKIVRLAGREPAAWAGLIEAGLFMLVAILALYLKDFDGEGFVVAAMALVSAGFGAYTAYATEDHSLGWIVGLTKASINLALFFGFGLPMEVQAAILSFVAVAAGFFQRTQTSPLAAPTKPTEVTMVAPVSVEELSGPTAEVDGAL